MSAAAQRATSQPSSTPRQPSHADPERLAAELNSVAIHLLRRVRATDASLGLTPARLSALSVLVFGGPRSLKQLADAEQVAAPTMSRIVAALERDGLVRREADPSDARAICLLATAAGTELLERGRQQRVERLAAELRALPVADQATLARAAAILRQLERLGPPVADS
jgi:DNA-binding MarR family transcriptional regulator